MTWQLSEEERLHSPGGWAEGYVVDSPYFEPMIPALSPPWLSAAAVLHGQPPLDLQGPLTWIDLGAGAGLSACMVAAANANVQVWGFDHNPAHVERAAGLAAAASLTNCHFREASFGELAADHTIGPSNADVIVVNGVFSWISAQNQQHIVEVIRQRLKPGGIAYVMYEAPTGWSSMVPLAETLRLHAVADGRRSDLAFHDAAAAVTGLEEAGARYFPVGPPEQRQMASWATTSGFYAAHEYLGEHFGPLMFDQVVPLLAHARCTYIGSSDLTDHIPHYWAPPPLAELVTSTHDVVLREMLRDLITQRPLRRDLFRRGVAMPLRAEQEAWACQIRLTWTGRHFEDKPVPIPIGHVTLDPTYHRPLVDALATGDLDVPAILEIHPGWTFADGVIALSLLIAAGFATPARPDGASAEAVASARRLNELLLRENRMGADHPTLVAPALGAALRTDIVEMIVFEALRDRGDLDLEALTNLALAELHRQGRTVREEGRLIDDPEQARAIVERRAQSALTTFTSVFERLGIT